MTRAFRLLWVGESTSSLGSAVTAVALPLVAIGPLHASVVQISALTAIAWLPWLVVGLPAGAWVDRWPRRPVMIACDVVSLLAFVSVPAAAWTGVLTLVQLFVVAALAGTAKVFFATAYRAFLPAILPAEQLTDGNARLTAAESSAQVAGPALGGVVAQALGAVAGLLLDAVSFAVSLVCLRRIDAPEPARTTTPGRLRTEIAEGARFVARDPLLRTNVLFGATANLLVNGYSAIALAFLVRGVGLSAGTAGLAIAVGQLGGVAGAVLAPRLGRRLGSARALLLVRMSAGPCGLLIPLTGADGRLALYVLGTAGMAAGSTAGNVLSLGFLPNYVPNHLMGRVTTSMQLANFGAIPVGAVLGGVLAAALGFTPALWLLLGGLALSGLLLLTGPLRTLHDLPTAAGVGTRWQDRAGAGRRPHPRGPRPRAARGGCCGPRAGVHPGRRRHGQDPGDHASHRLRGRQRRGRAHPAAGRHLHRPRRR